MLNFTNDHPTPTTLKLIPNYPRTLIETENRYKTAPRTKSSDTKYYTNVYLTQCFKGSI